MMEIKTPSLATQPGPTRVKWLDNFTFFTTRLRCANWILGNLPLYSRAEFAMRCGTGLDLDFRYRKYKLTWNDLRRLLGVCLNCSSVHDHEVELMYW